MALRRARFQGPIFPRKEETSAEWETQNHDVKSKLADGTIEIVGEVEPRAASRCSATHQSGGNEEHIEEYVWSLGLTGNSLEWVDRLHPDDGVMLQILVEAKQTRFVAREVSASLEYLPPCRTLPDHPGPSELTKTTASVVADGLEAFRMPMWGEVVRGISTLIPADQPKTKWFLKTFDLLGGGFGIEWHLSRNLLYEIGSRVVGRLGVAFFEAPLQGREDEPEGSLLLTAKCGLKLEAERSLLKHQPWYDFSLVPFPKDKPCLLRITPRCAEGVAPKSADLLRDQRASSIGLVPRPAEGAQAAPS